MKEKVNVEIRWDIARDIIDAVEEYARLHFSGDSFAIDSYRMCEFANQVREKFGIRITGDYEKLK